MIVLSLSNSVVLKKKIKIKATNLKAILSLSFFDKDFSVAMQHNSLFRAWFLFYIKKIRYFLGSFSKQHFLNHIK